MMHPWDITHRYHQHRQLYSSSHIVIIIIIIIIIINVFSVLNKLLRHCLLFG